MIHATQDSNCVTDDVTSKHASVLIYDADASSFIFSSLERSESVPGSVAETMAPKKRQSVKKKSPSSWCTCFISVTQPYINNLEKAHTKHCY